jgi:hypothetical protein
MHFFIDETGTFSGIGELGMVSIVGALAVPDARLANLEAEYAKLRRGFPLTPNGEVKGRSLNEAQIDSLIPILHKHEVLFECAAIDMGIHTEQGLRDFKSGYAERITGGLTPDHEQAVHETAHDFRRRFEALKFPLMVQSQITFEFIPRLLENTLNYFSLRVPEELAQFKWFIDAKSDQGILTDWEDWWTKFVLPYLQTQSYGRPLRLVAEGDYSHMNNFIGVLTPHVRKMAKLEDDAPPPFSLSRILQDVTFTASPTSGIELVDIITGATRRAMVGNLQKPGWHRIPTIMLDRDRSYIGMHRLQKDFDESIPLPYDNVLNAFREGGRELYPIDEELHGDDDWQKDSDERGPIIIPTHGLANQEDDHNLSHVSLTQPRLSSMLHSIVKLWKAVRGR